MLEQKIEALTAAVIALTAQMAGQTGIAVTGQTPVVTPPSFPAPTNAAAAPGALPNGMPGGPFGAQPTAPAVTPPSFAPSAAPGAPFADLKGCTDYAMAAYAALEAKGPGRGEIVTQLIKHLCGSNSINDLKSELYPAFYAELEKQKAL